MVRIPSWQDLRLGTKGLIVIALPAAATIIIACASYIIGNRAADAEREGNQSFRILEELQRLQTCELETSAQVRAYFITREENRATEAREASAAFDRTWQKLAGLTADNPGQTQRLARLGALEHSRVDRIVSTITRFKWHVLQWEELRTALRDGESERLAMEAAMTAIENEERGVLEARLRRADSLRARLRAVTTICGFLGVAGGALISLLFASGITHRIGKLRRNVGLLATGGVIETLPEGRDEIGELGKGMAKAAEVLRHRTAALENASHGIAEADAGGRYVSVNRAYRQLTGLSAARSVGDTVHPDDRAGVEQAIAQMRDSGRAEVEVRAMHPGGQIADVGMTFVPVSEKRDGGYFIFLRDISRRKEAETALVGARDAAVAANRAKSEFLAKISHDIRTPLNAILGAAELLSQSPLNSDQTAYVDMFGRNSRRLVALINDFLDFSKIEAGALRVESVPYQIQETVEQAVATFRESAQRKGLTLGIEIAPNLPGWAVGDGLRVQQVLGNLLSNAIKFTRQGRVDVKVIKTGGNADARLRFIVSDTGPGISAPDQAKIFAAFVQAEKGDAAAREGCGLGLAICRDLMKLMGGEIGLTSQAGCGSVFHLTLPLIEAPPVDGMVEPRARVRSPEQAESRLALRVLVAEDTEDNRLLIAHYLRDQPVELRFAEHGQEAVDAIRQGEQFDLVLMDIDMPVLDGLAATRAILRWQGERGLEPTPIVGLSAHAMRDTVRQCLDAGCAAHVAKPVDQATLLNTIRRFDSRARRTSAAAAGIPENIAALVPKYLESKPRQIEEARASLETKDFESIRRFGHNLRGTGAGYGFERIGDIGTEIEKGAIDHNERAIGEQLKALSEFLAEEQARSSGSVEVAQVA